MSDAYSRAYSRNVTLPQATFDALSYQSDAVRALEGLEYGAVFHEQGLGKTKIAIDLALSWLSTSAVDCVLVVTKRNLVPNWLREIERHTNVSPKVFSADRRANYFAFNSRARIFLAHYEFLSYEQERIQLWQKTRRIGAILDESQKIKNPEANVTIAAHVLRAGFFRRVIMTGTPIANRPYDVWSQIFFLDGGGSLGCEFPQFKEDFDFSPALATDVAERERFGNNLTWLFEQIRPFSVRETKASAGIQLPKKSIERIECELEPKQREIYDTIRRELAIEVQVAGAVRMDDAESVLKRLLRLVQVASNPRLVDERYSECPGKFTILSALLNSILANGEKAIIWTNFIANATWLAAELGNYGAACIHGSMTIESREKSINKFLTDPGCEVLVATVGSAKEGLTLTVANHAIFFDRSFNLDDYLQAQDRIHRISQVRDCFIYVLEAKRSVDEWIDQLLDAKRLAAQLAQGDIDLQEYGKHEKYEFFDVLNRILNGEHD